MLMVKHRLLAAINNLDGERRNSVIGVSLLVAAEDAGYDILRKKTGISTGSPSKSGTIGGASAAGGG